MKDRLKERGYRWDAGQRVWTIDIAQDAVPAELGALFELHPQLRPTLTEIDWFNRHTR